MSSNGVEVTLKPPDGEPFTQTAVLTLGTGPNGGNMYHNSRGFKIEIVGSLDGTHQVVDYGWADGRRGCDVINIWPVVVG